MANPKFEIKKSTSNEYYFTLHATNSKIIATSEMYDSKQGCEKGIASVKSNAANATIEDLT